MEKIATAFTDYLLKKEIIKEEDYEVYHVGFLLLMDKVITIILFLLIALSKKMLIEGILFYIIIKQLRRYAGGLHLNSTFACMVLSCITFYSYLVLHRINLNDTAMISIFLFSLMAVKKISIVSHKNRPIDEKDILYFSKNLNYSLIIICILGLVMYCFNFYFKSVWLCLLYMAAIQISGKYLNK